MPNMMLPVDPAVRKAMPLASGLLDYFPLALAEVAHISKIGNDQHNPGEDLHWARGKSMDNADCIARHLVDRGTIDPEDGQRHSGKLAWRALALLELELEAETGSALPRAARAYEPEPPHWFDGWKCGCGSTELYSAYKTNAMLQAAIGRGETVYCDAPGCYVGMVRDNG